MAKAALAMRDVMSREDEPSFVIKDKVIYRFVPPHNFDQFFIHD